MVERPPIIVDAEFAALIPPLTREEDQALTASIRREGCRDALVVWRTDGQDVLLDGHNRYRICVADGISYRIAPLDGIETRDEAAIWMLGNQRGRRNLTPDQASILRGEQYNRTKATQGRPSNNVAKFATFRRTEEGQETDQIDPVNSTADRLAIQYKVSAPTIKRDGQFADAADTLAANVGPQVKRAIVTGELPLPKRDIIAVAQAPVEEQRRVLAITDKVAIKAEAKKIREQEAAERRQARENMATLEEHLNDEEKRAREDSRRWKEDEKIGKVLERVWWLAQNSPDDAAAITIRFGSTFGYIQHTKDMTEQAIAWLRTYTHLLGEHLGTKDGPIRKVN